MRGTLIDGAHTRTLQVHSNYPSALASIPTLICKRGCEEVQRIYNSYSRALNSDVTSYSMVVKGYRNAVT